MMGIFTNKVEYSEEAPCQWVKNLVDKATKNLFDYMLGKMTPNNAYVVDYRQDTYERYPENSNAPILGTKMAVIVDPLVRCKECRISAIEGDEIEGTHYRWCTWIGHSVDEDSYCSWGERIDDGSL